MNTWLKRYVFNLDLNRESVSEPRMLSGRLFQSLGAKCSTSFSGLCYRSTTKSPEICGLREQVGL